MAGFGGAVKLTGESEYKAALKSITQSLKEVSSEMKVVSSAYGKNDNSINALTAKQDVLNKKLEQQKAKLSTLQAEYADMASEYDKNAQKHEKLVSSYNEESAKLKQLEATVGTTSAEYKEQAAVVEKLEAEVMKSAAAQDYNEAAMSKMRISINNATADINKTNSELNELESEMKQAASATDDLDNSMDDLDGSSGKLASGFSSLKVAAGNLIANGIQNAVQAVKGLVGEALNASDALFKFEKTMSFAGFDDKTIKKAKASMKQYADETVYDLDTISNTTAQLASNGVKDFTGLTQAAGNLNAVAGGNADSFRSVAMVLTQTAGAGKLTTENWNQLSDAVAGAAGPLQEQMKKNGAYTGNFRDAMAKGEITAEEFNTALMQLGTDPVAVEAAKSVETFEGAVGNMEATVVDGLMQIIETIGMENITGFINTVSEKIQQLIPHIKTAVQFVISNGNTIIKILAGIAAAFVVGKMVSGIMTVVNAFKILKGTMLATEAAQKAVTLAQSLGTVKMIAMKAATIASTVASKAMAAAQWLLNAAMSANPIGLVVAAVAALAAVFVIAWKKSEKFRKIVTGVWNALKSGVTSAVKAIKNTVTKVWDSISKAVKSIVDDIKKNALAAWNGIKAGITAVLNAILKIIRTVFGLYFAIISAAWNTIKAVTSAIWNGIKTVISNVLNAIKTTVTTVINGISTIITTVWNTIKTTTSTVWNAIKTLITTVINAIKTTVTTVINSISSTVSSVWNSIKSTTSSVWNGIKSTVSNVVNGIKSTVSSVVNSIKSTVSSVWNSIKSTTSSVWNGIKSAITKPIEAAKNTVKGIVDKLKGFFPLKIGKIFSNIKLPHFSVKGKAPFGLGGKGEKPSISVSWYAKGGVIDGAKLIGVGEQGAEAVVPLERNTFWIRKVAEEMASMSPFTIMADTMKQMQIPQANEIRYDKIVDAFTEALSRMTVELDDDQVGKFVIKTVENAIYT